ncbi:MAG TPA: glucokinase [Bryobacteraceae bacterium]|nr:glucokinase [Bryobacteraceae bacterium]
MILAGDIGGTHSRLAFFEGDPAHVEARFIEVYENHEHAGLAEIVKAFLDAHRVRVECACFGVPGPVRDGRVETPNLRWVLDARQLSTELGFRAVKLVNDLEANAWGIAALKPADFIVLQKGSPAACGNLALISAGTGLGEAGLVAEVSGYRPFPSEGGHADFGPNRDLEIELLRHLAGRFGHVSAERLVSGPGLHNIYEFLRDTGRGSEPEGLAAEIARGDAGAVISKRALAGTPEICVKALDIFVSIYGAEAGNLALKVMASGGVFIGGGIAPKIVPKLKEGLFLKAFRAKGRMAKVMEDIPVRVITNDKTALLGAGRVALASRESAGVSGR